MELINFFDRIRHFNSSSTMTRLRVLAGPSLASLEDISAKVNQGDAHDVTSDAFEGRIAVYIKGFEDGEDQNSESEFFKRDDRVDITWSIQVQGEYVGIPTFCI